MNAKKIRVGLLGIGTVGSGTYRILSMNCDKLTANTRSDIQVEKILVSDRNKKRALSLPKEILTEDPDDILKNPDIDIVVELLGGIHPAYDYMLTALQNGKHVVTANKAVIAMEGQALMQAALEHHVMLRYEASVCGGIPILNALSTSLCGNEFMEIMGIVNGTTNYILTQMTEYGLNYDDVLADAQAKGFAEADPTSDVEGIDAAYKLNILSSIAFGISIPPDSIPRIGITAITKEDIAFAAHFGCKIKLLATARRYQDQLECHVQPAMVPLSHPLASVNNEFNAIFVKGDAVDDIMLYGKGAGDMPTGSAVVGDIAEIAGRIAAGTADSSKPTAVRGSDLRFVGEGQNMYYVNLTALDLPGVLGKISTVLGEHGISIQSVMQHGQVHQAGQDVSLVFILHEVTRTRLDQALESICGQGLAKKVNGIIRVIS